MTKYLTLIVAALLIMASAGVSEAACGFRPFAGIRARRAAGQGLFQGNGPLRRAVGRGSCG